MLKKNTIALVLLAMSSAAHAGGYAGVGFGNSSIDIESTPYTVDKEDSDTAFSVFGGVDLNRNFAVEAGYVNLGEFSRSDASNDGVFAESLVQSVEGTAFYAALVGKLPVSDAVDLYAKGGLARWDVDLAATYTITDIATGASGTGSGSMSESGTDPMFGVGASFSASDTLAIRAEFTRFMDIGDEETTGQSDVNVIEVSAALKF